MKHIISKTVILIIFAVTLGIIAYDILTGVCERKNITEETHPVFADCLRAAIAAVSCVDMAMIIKLLIG